jgi:hypothetical protein
MAVHALGHLLAVHVTAADIGIVRLSPASAADIQDATGDTVFPAYVDQGYTGATGAEAAAAEGIKIEVVKLPETASRTFPSSRAGWCSTWIPRLTWALRW